MNLRYCFSTIYNLLVKSSTVRYKSRLINKYWYKIWVCTLKYYKGPVNTKMHGFKVEVNNGYMYPIFARLFPMYNNPLVQLVQSTYLALGRKIVVVDVGAAIGDTVFLLLKNCPDVIDEFYCIEGDDEFYRYLGKNLSKVPNSHIIKGLLSDIEGSQINELVKIHPGTASAIGVTKLEATSLDKVLFDQKPKRIDLIKIDVDGFDGQVLKGSSKVINLFKPSIIFEWHPIMMEKTKNDFKQPFDVLNELGYNKYLWFTKYGTFSHFDVNYDSFLNRIEWNKICLRDIHDFDFHFDIVALHRDSMVDIINLAELQYAKRKPSNY